jgi:hypothetical protein
MNCREFENIVSHLADDQLMEAVSRQRGLAHASVCESCATLLSEERQLNAALDGWAEETAGAQASPQLKTALRAAFDAQHSATGAPVTISEFRTTRRSWRWPLVAAAAMLALAVITAPLWWRAFTPDQQITDKKPAPSPTVTPPENLPQPEAARADSKPEVVRSTPVQKRHTLRRNPAPTGTVVAQASNDFIPLTWVSDAASVQSGLIVRVEVERSTLIAMGLPLNVERAGSRVKADLMLGDDGVARAIRLVQ